jgi:hypothetical protein
MAMHVIVKVDWISLGFFLSLSGFPVHNLLHSFFSQSERITSSTGLTIWVEFHEFLVDPLAKLISSTVYIHQDLL